MNNENIDKVNLIGHQIVDEFQKIGHEFVNSALGLGVPIINTMTNTNLNVNQSLNNVTYYRKNTETHIYLYCELPGVSKEQCKLNYKEQILTLHCSINENKDDWNYVKNKEYKLSVNVGLTDLESITAKFTNGILKITISKKIPSTESNIEIN